MKRKAVLRSPEEKSAIIAKIKAAVAGGQSVEAAVKQAGIHPATYYQWQRSPKRRKAPEHVTLSLPPEQEDGRVVFFMGPARDFRAALERI